MQRNINNLSRNTATLTFRGESATSTIRVIRLPKRPALSPSPSVLTTKAATTAATTTPNYIPRVPKPERELAA